MRSEMSRAATECVMAPVETCVTPDAAMAATVCRLTLPEASVSTCRSPISWTASRSSEMSTKPAQAPMSSFASQGI